MPTQTALPKWSITGGSPRSAYSGDPKPDNVAFRSHWPPNQALLNILAIDFTHIFSECCNYRLYRHLAASSRHAACIHGGSAHKCALLARMRAHACGRLVFGFGCCRHFGICAIENFIDVRPVCCVASVVGARRVHGRRINTPNLAQAVHYK